MLCCIAVRGSRPGKNVQLSENEIRGLCLKSREIFLSQPILLELEAPLKICGLSLSVVSANCLQGSLNFDIAFILISNLSSCLYVTICDI